MPRKSAKKDNPKKDSVKNPTGAVSPYRRRLINKAKEGELLDRLPTTGGSRQARQRISEGRQARRTLDEIERKIETNRNNKKLYGSY